MLLCAVELTLGSLRLVISCAYMVFPTSRLSRHILRCSSMLYACREKLQNFAKKKTMENVYIDVKQTKDLKRFH